MSANTAKYVIPYPVPADTIAGLAATIQNLANRVDLLLGESGTFSKNFAASTSVSTAISFARTYPGNATAQVPGILIPVLDATYANPNTVNWWVNTWTGTATTVTGCTLWMQWSNAQTARPINWRFFPVL